MSERFSEAAFAGFLQAPQEMTDAASVTDQSIGAVRRETSRDSCLSEVVIEFLGRSAGRCLSNLPKPSQLP